VHPATSAAAINATAIRISVTLLRADTAAGRFPSNRSDTDSSRKKNVGANTTATIIDARMPPITPVPIARRLLAPAPLAIASGTQPKPNASEVMTMARKRAPAAASAASRADIPAWTCAIATSQMRIAFFAESPTSVTRPTWKYTSFSSPTSHVSSSAPSTEIGIVSTTAIGSVHFSNCAASSRNTRINPNTNAELDVLPDSFSCSACPAHAKEKSPGNSRAISSIAAMACPEL
jgi:hypothetical protein